MPHLTTADLRRHGNARRVTVHLGRRHVRFQDPGVWVDADEGLVHLLDPDWQRHLATVPLAATVIEWEDVAPIRPHPVLDGPPRRPGPDEE